MRLYGVPYNKLVYSLSLSHTRTHSLKIEHYDIGKVHGATRSQKIAATDEAKIESSNTRVKTRARFWNGDVLTRGT